MLTWDNSIMGLCDRTWCEGVLIRTWFNARQLQKREVREGARVSGTDACWGLRPIHGVA